MRSMTFFSINRSESLVNNLAIEVNNAVNDNNYYSEDDKTVTSDNLTISLLVCSSTNFTVIFTYWTYLLYSSFIQNTSWPSLCPNLLMFGLFLGSSSILAHITLDPASPTSCISSTLVPISYTIIYSTLLVRLVYLQSLHKDMYRLSVSTLYQTLLVIFCVLVQVSLSTQSLLLSQLTVCPSHTSIYSSPKTDMLSLSYSFFLLMSITGFSTMLRRSRENRQEAWSIWILSILSMVLWVAWMTVTLVIGENYRAIKGLGQEVGASLTILILLLPQSRRLLFTGKVSPYSQARIPGFGSNNFSFSDGSSYMGFHRPTRVVPPSSYSSKSSSTPSSSPSYNYRYQTNNMFRYKSFDNRTGPPIVIPQHYGLQHPAYGAYTYNV